MNPHCNPIHQPRRHWPVFIFLLSLLLPALPVLGQGSGLYEVGDIVENHTFTNFHTGEAVELYDFAGKIVFIEWFAHWCPFCQAAAAEIEPQLVQYYSSRNGNPNGVEVMHIAANLQSGSEDRTQRFIDSYQLKFVVNDTSREVANRFAFGGQPIFAIINGVAGSPSHEQWELLLAQSGYGTLDAPIEQFRGIIDAVEAGNDMPDDGNGSGGSSDGLSEDVLAYFPTAVAAQQEGMATVEWLGGDIGIAQFPLIFHPRHGWLLAAGSADSRWFWDYALQDQGLNGFWYTAPDTYPFLYSLETASWWFFFEDTGGEDPRYFYDYGQGALVSFD